MTQPTDRAAGGLAPAAAGPPGLRGTHYKWVALSNTTLGMLAATVNASIVIIALPAIFRGIQLDPLTPGNVSYLLWMLMGYLVVSAVLVVTLGRLGDIYGRVRMYNAGFAIFGLGALALPFDPFTGPAGAMWLIGFRVIQAVGGAMLMANSPAILTDAFPASSAAWRWALTRSRVSQARSSASSWAACSPPWTGGWCLSSRCRSGSSAPSGPTSACARSACGPGHGSTGWAISPLPSA